MSSNIHSSRISPSLSITTSIIAMSCVACSIWQGGNFLASLSDNPIDKRLYFAAASALLLGSLAISRLIGTATGRVGPWILVVSLACVLALEAFSISTSMSGFSSRFIMAERDQNTSSPEYQAARDQVTLITQQIASETQAMRAMPGDWITRRQQASDRINRLQDRLTAAQDRLDAVDVSTTGRTFAGIQAATGVTQTHIALLGAVLLSATPFTLMLLLGGLSQNTAAREVPAGKKPQRRPNLRAA